MWLSKKRFIQLVERQDAGVLSELEARIERVSKDLRALKTWLIRHVDHVMGFDDDQDDDQDDEEEVVDPDELADIDTPAEDELGKVRPVDVSGFWGRK